ncbi:MAG: DUF3369 domain-containing protein [Candidatus Marinarcus sp.]|uniref:DUF3369 domain-containing protein n=1 Tax=Candidatus Marinarcus sp. TaxID=3100987 RepID=UPI003AFFBA89
MNNSNPMKFAHKVKEPLLKDVWKVLIVDDEESVHSITNTVLHGITFENKKLQFLSAYSAVQARQLLLENPDIALILLDVVMEEDNAGLEYVEYVREELKNKLVRIVIRTGQPGHAPQREVIDQYDINDYKEKTELTAEKLYTTVIASLRNYKDLKVMEERTKEETSVSTKSSPILGIDFLIQFSQTSLNNLLDNLRPMCDTQNVLNIQLSHDKYILLAAVGEYLPYVGENVLNQLDKKLLEEIQAVLKSKTSQRINDQYIHYYETSNGNVNLLCLSCSKELNDASKKLIDFFSSSVTMVFEQKR